MGSVTKPEVLVIQDLKNDLTSVINKAMEQGLPVAVVGMIVRDLQTTLRGLEQEELKCAVEKAAQSKEE